MTTKSNALAQKSEPNETESLKWKYWFLDVSHPDVIALVPESLWDVPFLVIEDYGNKVDIVDGVLFKYYSRVESEYKHAGSTICIRVHKDCLQHRIPEHSRHIIGKRQVRLYPIVPFGTTIEYKEIMAYEIDFCSVTWSQEVKCEVGLTELHRKETELLHKIANLECNYDSLNCEYKIEEAYRKIDPNKIRSLIEQVEIKLDIVNNIEKAEFKKYETSLAYSYWFLDKNHPDVIAWVPENLWDVPFLVIEDYGNEVGIVDGIISCTKSSYNYTTKIRRTAEKTHVGTTFRTRLNKSCLQHTIPDFARHEIGTRKVKLKLTHPFGSDLSQPKFTEIMAYDIDFKEYHWRDQILCDVGRTELMKKEQRAESSIQELNLCGLDNYREQVEEEFKKRTQGKVLTRIEQAEIRGQIANDICKNKFGYSCDDIEQNIELSEKSNVTNAYSMTYEKVEIKKNEINLCYLYWFLDKNHPDVIATIPENLLDVPFLVIEDYGDEVDIVDGIFNCWEEKKDSNVPHLGSTLCVRLSKDCLESSIPLYSRWKIGSRVVDLVDFTENNLPVSTLDNLEYLNPIKMLASDIEFRDPNWYVHVKYNSNVYTDLIKAEKDLAIMLAESTEDEIEIMNKLFTHMYPNTHTWDRIHQATTKVGILKTWKNKTHDFLAKAWMIERQEMKSIILDLQEKVNKLESK